MYKCCGDIRKRETVKQRRESVVVTDGRVKYTSDTPSVKKSKGDMSFIPLLTRIRQSSVTLVTDHQTIHAKFRNSQTGSIRTLNVS